jgi:N-acetylglucosamine-6-phosphate deacetylase
MSTVITAGKLFDGAGGILEQPVVVVEDDRIASISMREAGELPAGARVMDFPGATLGPAFFDVHIHGAAGHDVMEGTPEALEAMGKFLAAHGTGAFLAATVTAPLDATLRAVESIARLIAQPMDNGAARPVGIHLEGPFLSHAKRGVHPAEHLLAPSIPTFNKLFAAAEGKVRLITLAPELPGALELARHATERGVRVSLGHSDATAAETHAAIAVGAVSATHTFNAMRPLDHQEPGILGTVLSDDRLFAELICDGVHSKPDIARLWWRAKGRNRAILITDAMSATGMPDGEYRLGGFPVQVANGRATHDGVLAGSVLTLDRALENFVAFTGAEVEDGMHLLTTNPATMIGLGDGVGKLAAGHDANLVVVNAQGRLMASIVRGRVVAGAAA